MSNERLQSAETNDESGREQSENGPLAQSAEQRAFNPLFSSALSTGCDTNPAVSGESKREPFGWYGFWDEDSGCLVGPVGHEAAHIDGLCWCDKLPSATEYQASGWWRR